MKKVILSLAIVAMATLTASAQDSKKPEASSFTLDLGANGALPIGTPFSDYTSFGIGGFLKGAIPLSDNIDGTLTATYLSFQGKTVNGFKYPASGLFSALAGGSYKLDGGLHIDAGIGFGTFSNGGGSGFAYRGGVGYKLEGGLDITANYNGISANSSTVSYIGLGIAYTIVK